jgi:HTH-type transcriptional regulator/antitoxin HipB
MMSSIAVILLESAIVDMRVRTTQDLGAVIKNRRRHLRLDQASLAARVGVSRQWIVAIERGKPRADVALVLRTLEALGLPLHVDEATPAGRSAAEAPVTAGVSPDIDAIVDAARRPPPLRPASARAGGRRRRKPRA